MMYIKNLLFYISSLVIILILIIGIYKGWGLVQESRNLKKEGNKTIAVIDKVWKGKCGSGYGYFANYKFEVNGKFYRSTSSCTAGKDTKIGDKFYVIYLEDNPSINHILFDEYIGN